MVATVVGVGGCSGVTDSTDQPVVTGTPHLLEPTEQMVELAERQCLDDPLAKTGEIQAVDPEDPDRVLTSVVVDCAEVRAGE